jgi:hypothetical protein
MYLQPSFFSDCRLQAEKRVMVLIRVNATLWLFFKLISLDYSSFHLNIGIKAIPGCPNDRFNAKRNDGFSDSIREAGQMLHITFDSKKKPG